MVTVEQYNFQVTVVDGGTVVAPTYFSIISRNTGIQYTLMVGGFPSLLLK